MFHWVGLSSVNINYCVDFLKQYGDFFHVCLWSYFGCFFAFLLISIKTVLLVKNNDNDVVKKSYEEAFVHNFRGELEKATKASEYAARLHHGTNLWKHDASSLLSSSYSR